MTTAHEAGVALAALLSHCEHPTVVPVDLALTGEIVAMLCADCLLELPLAWGCDDCQWVEVRRLCDPVAARRLGTPCVSHRG